LIIDYPQKRSTVSQKKGQIFGAVNMAPPTLAPPNATPGSATVRGAFKIMEIEIPTRLTTNYTSHQCTIKTPPAFPITAFK
jgi:hypothetical protein